MSARHAALLLAAMYCGLCTFGPTAMMTMPIFRLSRCREQLLNSLDVSAVRRKFIRLRQEDFLEESEESWEQRQLARRNFEAASELAYLFGENDKDLEASERTPEDLSLWAMHEQLCASSNSGIALLAMAAYTVDPAYAGAYQGYAAEPAMFSTGYGADPYGGQMGYSQSPYTASPYTASPYAMPGASSVQAMPYQSYTTGAPMGGALDHSQGKWFAPGEALPPGFMVTAHPEGHAAPAETHAMSDQVRESFVVSSGMKTGSAAPPKASSKSKKSKKSKKSGFCC
ncbi:unnamed protein product [Effrenium voratum]|uniref:Uncharacterized protein n=1 Tax=Effrenium voratum TaxID=2562239 RepID=A0AA36IGX4_9DINO|nr:unnamed protein product [Effrenium voratum]